MTDKLLFSNLLVFIFIGVMIPGYSQIMEHPINHNPLPGTAGEDQVTPRSAKKLTIPFADDFSADHPYPDPDYWMDKQVYINNHLPLNPPSYGVATFDGLDQYGLPYGGGYGGSDTLTSHPFDLAGETTVYLSYFLQPKGIGYLPQIRDSFVVEGIDIEGEWQTLAIYEGLDDSYASKEAPEFQRASVRLESRFLHPDFQVRFRNYSSNKGLEALWHLDYVMLTREMPDRYVDDISFVEAPGYLLKRYTSYPLTHLQINPDRLKNEFPIHLRNNSKNRFTIDSSEAVILDIESQNEIYKDRSLLEIPPIVEENQRNIDPGSARFVNTFNIRNVENYLLDARREKVVLATEYNYIMREEQNLPAFQQNNHVRRETTFSNYLAYDDHSAEGAISTYNSQGIRVKMAVEYELEKEDTLQSVRILFPYMVESYDHKNFNLLIYTGELKETPDYIIKGLQPVMGNAYQPFTEYKITDHIEEGILLPAGKFYIGWEHPGGTHKDYIPFGFDKNNPKANEYIYFHPGDQWLNVAESSPDLQGAILMRPVVGSDDVLTHEQTDVESQRVTLYPNPASDEIKLDFSQTPRAVIYQIFDSQGRLRKSGNMDSDRIQISELQTGSFTLILFDTNHQIIDRLRFIKF